MARWRYRALSLGLGLIGARGPHAPLRRLGRGCGIILMFHSVRPATGASFAPNRSLEVTPDFLGRCLDVVAAEGFAFTTLDSVPERVAAGDRGEPFAVVTFDDGYRDNRDHALEVLRRRRIPWAVFVTTEFAEGSGRAWWVELERALARLDEVRIGGENPIRLACRRPAEKAEAFAVLHRRARAASRSALLDDMDRLLDAARLDPAEIVQELFLDWGELRDLARQPGVTIGAHGTTHHALARHGEAEARRELFEGRAILEARLGLPVRHLAYPFGDPSAAGPREFALARDAGFTTAITTRRGHLSARHAAELHALPRIPINGHLQHDAVVRALASGLPFLGAEIRAGRIFSRGQRWTASSAGASLRPS